MVKCLVGFLLPLGCPKVVLGPLLFIIYINDLPSILKSSTPYLFADDTKCCSRVLSLNDPVFLQADLDSLSEWCQENDLSFNTSKLCLLRFCNRAKSVTPFDYSINGTSITSRDLCKDLGIIFSSDLSWTEHYNTTTAKAYQTLGLIRQSFSLSVPIRVKKCLFISLVRSKLTYCSQVWRPHLIKDICLLEQIQRRGTKYILNDFQSDYKSRLISLNLLPLMYMYEILDILFLVKNLKRPDPSLPIHDFILFSSLSTRAGCTSKLVHQESSTSTSSHSYFRRVTRLWNAIPIIDLNCSLPIIKLHLKKYMWN